MGNERRDETGGCLNTRGTIHGPSSQESTIACSEGSVVKDAVIVSSAAGRAVRRGHPWIFSEPVGKRPPGSLVALRDRDGIAGWGLVDHGEITVRVLGRGEPDRVDLPSLIQHRIHDADAARWRMIGADTTCWRVVNGEGDGLPGVIVDRYGEVAVLRIYSRAWAPHHNELVRAIARLPWVGSIVERFGVRRVDDRTDWELLHGPAVPDALVVTEHGMKMLVRPLVGQKTGLFLDQRAHRAQIRTLASGRTVANLFAYTGGFSVAAALGGAAHTTTVDQASDAIDDARETFRLNGLDPSEHAFEVADVFKWTPQHTVDLLIVDPPSLTRGARSDNNAVRAYTRLHRDLSPFVPRQGLLATASCTARLDVGAWREAVTEGLTGDWSWHTLSTHAVDHPVSAGHPEGWYLKFGVLRRR